MALTLVVCLNATALRAQDAPLPTFDVASVKQETSGEQPTNNWQRSPGRIDYQNSQILQLIRAAFGDFSLRVDGFPAWTRDERYDIDVRFPADTPGDTLTLMLRELLTTRFKMVARIETRQTPIYALVMTRSDRSLGPKLQPADPACAPNAFNPPAQCQPRISVPGGTLMFPYNDMAGLARTLTTMQGFLGRPVVDHTGLTGFFRIDLQFAPPPAPAQPGAAPAAVESSLPSIFTALPEQLGLRLEATTGPVPFIVIDSIERPTPD
jgi:uncharacterized protein (TIGR03435 family)